MVDHHWPRSHLNRPQQPLSFALPLRFGFGASSFASTAAALGAAFFPRGFLAGGWSSRPIGSDDSAAAFFFDFLAGTAGSAASSSTTSSSFSMAFAALPFAFAFAFRGAFLGFCVVDTFFVVKLHCSAAFL